MRQHLRGPTTSSDDEPTSGLASGDDGSFTSEQQLARGDGHVRGGARARPVSDVQLEERIVPGGWREEASRLLAAIRTYAPGNYSSLRTRHKRVAGTAARAMSRVTFVGEFGAGKSSVINTLLHVISEAPAAEFVEVAPTGDGAQRQTQVADSYQVPTASGQSATIGLFDVAGWEQFNARELSIMEEMRKYGVRERAEQLGTGAGWDKGDIGYPPEPSHAFVWVFRLAQSAVPRARLFRQQSPDVGSAPAGRAFGLGYGQALGITRKGLELDTEGRKTFQRFFALATLQGMRPVVVLTHIDGFSEAQVAEGKRLVSYLTNVSSDDIVAMRCFTSKWHPRDPATTVAALRILDRALALAERYDVPDSLIYKLDQALYVWSLRLRGKVTHFRYASTLRPALVLLFVATVLSLALWLGVHHVSRYVCRTVHNFGLAC